MAKDAMEKAEAEQTGLRGTINAFLTQGSEEAVDLSQTFNQLKQTMN